MTSPAITSYWDGISYGFSATYEALGAAVSYIPGVSAVWGPVIEDEVLGEAIRNVFLTAALNHDQEIEVTADWVAGQMGVDVEKVQTIYNSLLPELEVLQEKTKALAFYQQYAAGDIPLQTIANKTGLTPERVVDIFNSL